MKLVYMIIFPILLLTGCLPTSYLIKHDDTTFTEMNEKLKGEKVALKLITGEIIVGDSIYVKTDSTCLADTIVPTVTIKEITYSNHGKGLLAGIGWGFLSGLLIGGIIGELTSENEQPSGTLSHMDLGGVSEGAVIGVTGALTGLLLGGVYGGVSGVTDKFVFPSPEIESKPAKPTNRVEFTKVIEKGRGYIIIIWHGK